MIFSAVGVGIWYGFAAGKLALPLLQRNAAVAPKTPESATRHHMEAVREIVRFYSSDPGRTQRDSRSRVRSALADLKRDAALVDFSFLGEDGKSLLDLVVGLKSSPDARRFLTCDADDGMAFAAGRGKASELPALDEMGAFIEARGGRYGYEIQDEARDAQWRLAKVQEQKPAIVQELLALLAEEQAAGDSSREVLAAIRARREALLQRARALGLTEDEEGFLREAHSSGAISEQQMEMWLYFVERRQRW